MSITFNKGEKDHHWYDKHHRTTKHLHKAISENLLVQRIRFLKIHFKRRDIQARQVNMELIHYAVVLRVFLQWTSYTSPSCWNYKPLHFKDVSINNLKARLDINKLILVTLPMYSMIQACGGISDIFLAQILDGNMFLPTWHKNVFLSRATQQFQPNRYWNDYEIS